jgi:iron complex outermembrane receptor protein
MRRHHLGWLTSSAICTAMATATPALAQQTQPDDIIVTARRIDERLQDVPISISVVNQAEINNRNITNTSGLTEYVPSLSLDRRFSSENASFSIRGFYQEAATTPTVGVYFAEAPAPRGGSVGQTTSGDGVGPGSLFDIQNVQVLKGPQGTLFGRNTTGGTILIVPKKPTRDFEGYVEGSYGNYDMYRLQGVLNVPLSENVRLRLGADHMDREGWQKNISGFGPRRFADLNYIALRGSLVVDIAPELENYTVATYSRFHNNNTLNKIFACNPASFLGGINDQLGVCRAQLDRQADAGFYSVQNGYPDPRVRQRQWQVINTTTWQASDDLTVKNIVSYADFRAIFANNPFGDNFVIDASRAKNLSPSVLALLQSLNGQRLIVSQANPAPGLNSADQSTFSEEFQLQGRSFGGKLTWQTGVYVETSNPTKTSGGQPTLLVACTNPAAFQCTDIVGTVLANNFGVPVPPAAIPAFAQIGQLGRSLTEVRFRNYGIFAQGTFALSDQFKVTAGLRYSWDKMSGYGQLFQYVFPTPNTPVASCVNPLANPQTPNDLVNGCIARQKSSSDKPTGMIDLEFTPTPDLLIYAKYSRGYRQAGIQPRTVVAGYGPEKIDAYEVGSKISFNTGALSGNFNLAAFYNDLSNQQLLNSIRIGGATYQALVNIGGSRVYGLELDSTLRYGDFRLDVGAAYLNTKVTDIGAAADILTLVPEALRPQTTVTQLTTKGQPLPLAPKYRATITGTYSLPIPEDLGDLSIQATYVYTSKSYNTAPDGFDGPNAPADYVEATNLVNASINWQGVAGSPVDVSLFATNLFKEKYITAYLGGYNSLGIASGRQGEPRMYGIRARYSFGAKN